VPPAPFLLLFMRSATEVHNHQSIGAPDQGARSNRVWNLVPFRWMPVGVNSTPNAHLGSTTVANSSTHFIPPPTIIPICIRFSLNHRCVALAENPILALLSPAYSKCISIWVICWKPLHHATVPRGDPKWVWVPLLKIA
jgi:hypothetical protein